jgi:hypothetical protein
MGVVLAVPDFASFFITRCVSEACIPRLRFLKLRYSDNPTRKRGKTGIDFASLTLRVTKILVSQTKRSFKTYPSGN